jgi:hypothetical protein
MVKNNKNLIKNNLMAEEHMRKRIYIILKNVERFNKLITKKAITHRVLELFKCKAVIIATEKRDDNLCNYHIGVLNTNASRYTAKKLILKEFKEFHVDELKKENPNDEILVKFTKSWRALCQQLIRVHDDIEAMYYYGTDSSEVNHLVFSRDDNPKNLIIKLKNHRTFEDIMNDPLFSKKLITNFSSIYRLYNFIHNIAEDDEI